MPRDTRAGRARSLAHRLRRCPHGRAHGGAGLLCPGTRGGERAGLGLRALRPGLAQWRDHGPAHRRPDPPCRGTGNRRAPGADHRRRGPAAGAAAGGVPGRGVARQGGRGRRYGRFARVPFAPRLSPRRHRARAGGVRDPRRHRRRVPAGRRGAAQAGLLRRRAGAGARLRPDEPDKPRRAAGGRAQTDERGRPGPGVDPALPPGLPRAVRRRRRPRPTLRGGERRPGAGGHGALAAAVPPAPGQPVRLPAGRRGHPGFADRRGGRGPARADRRLL